MRHGFGAAYRDIELQERCLELVKDLPETENDPRQAAYLTDKVRVRHGQPQIYGTQYVKKGEDLVLYDVQDPEGLMNGVKSSAFHLPVTSMILKRLNVQIRKELLLVLWVGGGRWWPRCSRYNE